jgi:PTH1 family peptidyl-tRNA hydrolase
VQKHGGVFTSGRLAEVGTVKLKGRELVCIKPTTFMNLSGKSVGYHIKNLEIPVNQLVVVTDDLALPLGMLRLRPSGSHGGHNGLRNIEEVLGTNQYMRFRIGIGNNFPKGKQVEYVLSEFSKEEQPCIKNILTATIEGLLDLAFSGPDRVMTRINGLKNLCNQTSS